MTNSAANTGPPIEAVVTALKEHYSDVYDYISSPTTEHCDGLAELPPQERCSEQQTVRVGIGGLETITDDELDAIHADLTQIADKFNAELVITAVTEAHVEYMYDWRNTYTS